jgi:hypothetical protein
MPHSVIFDENGYLSDDEEEARLRVIRLVRDLNLEILHLDNTDTKQDGSSIVVNPTLPPVALQHLGRLVTLKRPTGEDEIFVELSDSSGVFYWCPLACVGSQGAAALGHYKEVFTSTNGYIVVHNLGVDPHVTVIDSAGNEIEVEVTLDTPTQLTLGFIGTLTDACVILDTGVVTAGRHYEETFTSATPHVVTHNLGREPQVTLLDVSGNEIAVEVQHDTVDQLTLSYIGTLTNADLILDTGRGLHFERVLTGISSPFSLHHYLGTRPQFQLVDSNGIVIEADVNHVDNNQIDLTFIGTLTAEAICDTART